ncbi:hypothetical protein KY465_07605 [Pseudohoeflea sp. DP4N28-3]|uniref:Lipoprotein n=2 Tax=Pseudohoeflea coraliihabitans TaxID=2860393 RepID=A0ABS6WMH5_9HYPH|nr:hypothetical protein [Pseudohoeflea sp. DP4N28-3]
MGELLRSTTAFFAFALTLAASFTGCAYGATITKSDNDVCVLKLEGEIIAGDFARFMQLAAAEFKGVDGESSSADTICLNSPGGSVLEGVNLAKQFYKQGVGTVIPAGAECHSMCAIMFMMGIAQGPEVNFVNRRLHVTGTLGFHRPYLALDSDELVSARALPVAHDWAMEAMMELMILANSQVPWSASTMMRPDLIQLMLTHVGNDFYYIDTVEKAGRFEIELFGYDRPTELTAERSYYACENSFHWKVGLIGKDTDYANLVQSLGAYQPVSKVVQDKGGLTIYSVTSGDAGYSEAGCLIGQKDDYFLGCGFNGMYNISLGLSQCTLADFYERSQWVSPLAAFKPSTPIRMLAAHAPRWTESMTAGSGACVVIAPTGTVEQEPCEARPISARNGSGDDIGGYEFIWPSGSKTVLLKDGTNLTLNGKPAYAVPLASYTLCVVNGETGNRFCFNKGS